MMDQNPSSLQLPPSKSDLHGQEGRRPSLSHTGSETTAQTMGKFPDAAKNQLSRTLLLPAVHLNGVLAYLCVLSNISREWL